MDSYNVIFTGRVAEGTTQQQVEEKLLQLIGCSADSIRPFFQGKALLLKKNLSRNRAEVYAKAFTQAGAVCIVRKSGQVFKQINDSESQTTGEEPVMVVSPVIGPAKLAFTPLPSPSLAAAEGGININRKDRTFVPFEDITLASVAYDSGRGRSALRLLIFIRPERRPVIVDAEKIAFASFPGVSGNNLLSSLRLFLTFLLKKNSRLLIDEETDAFLKGGRPSELGKDIDALATALATLVPAKKDDDRKAIGLKSSPVPVRPAVDTDASHDPAPAFTAESVGQSDVETQPREHSTDKPPIPDKGKVRKAAIVYFVLSLFFCLGLVSFISKIGQEGGSSRSNWVPSISRQYSGQFFKESPELKRQRELLEYNRKMAKLTDVLGIIICALLTFFFFRKAQKNWATYRHLD